MVLQYEGRVAELGGSQIVVQRTRRSRVGEELDPLFGKRVLQPRVVGTNYVWSVAIAAHELLMRRRIVNLDQVTGVWIGPIAKISLPRLGGCRSQFEQRLNLGKQG